MFEALLWFLPLLVSSLFLLYKYKISVGIMLLATSVLFIPAMLYDWLMFNYSDYYIVNESKILGVWLFDMPIEEYLFAFVYPILIILLYESIHYKRIENEHSKLSSLLKS